MDKKAIAVVAISGGIFIFCLKLVAYFLSNSVALLSDALESIVNIVASIMLFFAVWVAEKPVDRSHNYGHQKIENISCFIEGVLVLLAAYFIAEAAIGRFFNSVELFNVNLALIVSVSATSLNGFLSWFLFRASKKAGSIALEGDAKHLLSDVLSSFGVWIGLIIVTFTGWVILDPIMALIVAVLIVRMGIGLLIKSSRDLMDHSCPYEEVKIKQIMLQNKTRYVDFHDLKTRRGGNNIFAEFHLCVSGNMTVIDAHNLTDYLENELKKEIPQIQTTIHVETYDNKKKTCV